jgi:transmembrane sensor
MDVASQQSPRSRRRAARAEAAAWIVRLHGPHRSPELEGGLREWLAVDAENVRQFERVTEVWDLGAMPVPGMARVGHWPEFPSRSPARKWLLAAALAVVLIGGGFLSASYFWLDPTYSTGIGERRTVRLSDGSRITLNTESRVAVAYREEQRRVRIERGEVFFEVANSARPFLVRAGEQEVTALGTSFNVRYEADRTTVTLVAGKVSVSVPASGSLELLPTVGSLSDGINPETPDAGSPKILIPGQRLVLVKSKPPQLDEPRIEAVTAWRRGEIILDKTALADAIAEMNRYDQVPLVIDDPKIAALEISGIYHTGDSAAFGDMIARLYGLEVVHGPERIHLKTVSSATAASK